MKKLRLEPESLRVQGFQTGRGGAERGTVAARAQCTYVLSCPCNTGRWACGPHTAYSCDYTQAGPDCVGSFPTEVSPSCICA